MFSVWRVEGGSLIMLIKSYKHIVLDVNILSICDPLFIMFIKGHK